MVGREERGERRMLCCREGESGEEGGEEEEEKWEEREAPHRSEAPCRRARSLLREIIRRR